MCSSSLGLLSFLINMIGIYKITSPSKRVYIGQSINIEERFKAYKKLWCKGQTRLYESFKKHGVDSHIFEVINQCEINELNELERYYQEINNVLGKGGLNCQYVKTETKKYVHSKETREKISNSNKGKAGRRFVMSEEHRFKIGQSKIGKKRPDFAKMASEYGKKRIGEQNTFYNKKHSKESLLKISISKKGKNMGLDHVKSKIVLDKECGVFYYSILEASNFYNFKASTLHRMLYGKLKNKTNLIIV
jgi:group I intron endonuclease